MSGSRRIVLVDDSFDSISALAALLRRKGYEVLGATGGEAALELLEKHSCSIVITDWRMPGLNGLELARIVKEHFPRVRVVLVTAYALQYQACGEAQCVDVFIPKPIDPIALLRTVETLMSEPTEDYTKADARRKSASPQRAS